MKKYEVDEIYTFLFGSLFGIIFMILIVMITELKKGDTICQIKKLFLMF